MKLEIERKFLLGQLPLNINRRKGLPIRQGYLMRGEDEEIRIRQLGRAYYLTHKRGRGVKREETEIRLKESQFLPLWEAVGNAKLEKIRYKYAYLGNILEIDQFMGPHNHILTAEIEFKSLEDARAFKVPDFFKEEVTFDPRYKNSKLVSHGPETLMNLQSGDTDSLIGTIPYLKTDEGLKVVLVTTRGSGDWIFPKGRNEDKMDESEVALAEGYEEGGFQGKITGRPQRLPYAKGDIKHNLTVYPIEVTELLESWPECGERKRQVVSLAEAVEISNQVAVHSGVDYLQFFLESSN